MSIATEITRLQAAKSDIKAAIENKGVEVGDGTLDTYAGKIAEIEVGDYNQGYADGKQDEYDFFWDTYQDNGERTSYQSAFFNWDEKLFYPKYSFNITNGSNAFANSDVPNFKERLTECGLTFNTSQATSLDSMFVGAITTHIPVVSAENTTNVKYVFYNCSKVVTIDKLILREDGTNTFQVPFASCKSLENIVIEGVIGQNGFNIAHSTLLTHDSLMSIINALADYSADESGTSWVVTLGTTNLAKLTDEEKAIATEKGWTLA